MKMLMIVIIMFFASMAQAANKLIWIRSNDNGTNVTFYPTRGNVAVQTSLEISGTVCVVRLYAAASNGDFGTLVRSWSDTAPVGAETNNDCADYVATNYLAAVSS